MMTPKACSVLVLSVSALVLASTGCSGDAAGGSEEVRGWLSWRGPDQNGTSPETDLPEQVLSGEEPQGWTYQLSGRGTPVVANGRVYTLGYEGEQAELQELLVCLDAETGAKIWEHRFTDFLTDAIYSRFSIGSPTIDPETGNVLCLTTAGLMNCFTADGELIWQHSMMSEYGRLTFPNGRTGSALIDGELAIVHVITSGWGPYGPARDRFWAFDKLTGETVWSSVPGISPKDSSFSFPVVTDEGNRRVLYAGLGGGSMTAVDVRTGDPLWRFVMATGGVNSSALLYKDMLIAIHGRENLDSSSQGRMIAIRRGALPRRPGEGPAVLEPEDYEEWRNDMVAFTSSPILVGNRVYAIGHTGELACIDADSGEILWHEKLAPDQIHASPAWGDGKLYVPMNNGTFHIVRPTDDGPEILQEVQLEGNCLGAPAIAGGRIFVHTTDRLYCFGSGTDQAPAAPPAPVAPPAGEPVRLQVIPADILAQPGESIPYRVRSLDANGVVVSETADAEWSGLPGSGVTMDAAGMTITSTAPPTAFNLRAASGDLQGAARVRIVPSVPFSHNFNSAILSRDSGSARTPPYWLGGFPKWEVRELEGNKVLAKTLNNPLFQRTMTLIGHPDMSNYTVQADVLSDGRRRRNQYIMSSAGVVNQRYLIRLEGPGQELEVSSNMELLQEAVPFQWDPSKWYTIKSRVDVEDDGSGWIRAKAWPRGEAEPADWTIEARHPNAHTHGSPGLYGFSLQSRYKVYIDNVSVTSNG